MELSPLLSGAAPRPHFPALHFGRRRQAHAGEQEPLARHLSKHRPPKCEVLTPAGGRVGPAALENSLTGVAPK